MERTTCLDDGECVLADDQVDVKFNAASTALASTHDFKHAKVSKTGSGDIADLLQQLQGALLEMSLKTESSPELAVADSAQCPPVLQSTSTIHAISCCWRQQYQNRKGEQEGQFQQRSFEGKASLLVALHLVAL